MQSLDRSGYKGGSIWLQQGCCRLQRSQEHLPVATLLLTSHEHWTVNMWRQKQENVFPGPIRLLGILAHSHLLLSKEPVLKIGDSEMRWMHNLMKTALNALQYFHSLYFIWLVGSSTGSNSIYALAWPYDGSCKCTIEVLYYKVFCDCVLNLPHRFHSRSWTSNTIIDGLWKWLLFQILQKSSPTAIWSIARIFE